MFTNITFIVFSHKKHIGGSVFLKDIQYPRSGFQTPDSPTGQKPLYHWTKAAT